MKCSKCGFDNKAGSKFCLKCGNKLFYEANGGINIEKSSMSVKDNAAGNNEMPKKIGHKNMIIALSSVAAVVLICGIFVSVGSKAKDRLEDVSASMTELTEQAPLYENVTSDTTAQNSVTTKATTTSNDNLTSETSTYKDIYSSYLENADTNEYEYFELFDLDSDGTPELFLSRGMAHMSQVDIYGIDKNGKMILLGEKFGAYGYVPMKGRYIAGGRWMEKSGDKLVECSDDLQQKLENDMNVCDDIGYKYEIVPENIKIAFDDFDADPTHGGDVYKYDWYSENSSVQDNAYDELDYNIARLTDVSNSDYSLYDIFTDVESVSELVGRYSGGELTAEDFFHNCYSYYWFFGDDYGQVDQFSLCVYVADYHEPAYRIYVPLKEVVPYLKDTFSHNLLPYIYSNSFGNTEGNYANFSGCVTQTDCGIPNGLIYCGGSDYSDWRVRYYYNSTAANVGDWYDEIVVNDLSDMVLYEDGGGDYSYIYYRNSGEDCALYRVSLDGSERIKLTEKRASNVRLYDNYIYYSSDKKFWRMNRDGSEKTKIIDAYCYLPSFYNDMIYCISSDDSCLDVYSINGGNALDHIYLDSRPMHIDNFFIKSGVLIARGYYTDNEEHFVIIRSFENPNVSVQYSMDCGGINADDYYIYLCYDDNGALHFAKIPLLEFTNTEAVLDYNVPEEFINSYFYLIQYGPDKYYIYQADNDGIWHRLDLY